MRFLSAIAIATVSASVVMQANPASAQNFDDRWSIIPKAHADPAPDGSSSNPPQVQQSPPSSGGETTQPEDHSAAHSSDRVFSGNASFYSYQKGKTASGSAFDRDLPTAAHRTLPFGTKVRVTDLTTSKSVVVRITDRGPHVRDRILDLSLGAARSLGVGDRGVIQVRAEVL
jgi:rare lipoprotein A